MNSKPTLKLAWCDYHAAKFAVFRWHYSRTMPIGKLIRVGVWEASAFVGCVIFGQGAGKATDGRRYGLGRTLEMCELVRVALGSHATPVSRIVAIAIRMVKAASPGLRLIVSFADPAHNHTGGIYQAGNWTYVGESARGLYYRRQDGTLTHNRNLSGPKGFGGRPTDQSQASYLAARRKGLADGTLTKVVLPRKYKYLMPLDDEMRQRIAPLAKPYPKRVRSDTGDTPGLPAGRGQIDTDPHAFDFRRPPTA